MKRKKSPGRLGRKLMAMLLSLAGCEKAVKPEVHVDPQLEERVVMPWEIPGFNVTKKNIEYFDTHAEITIPQHGRDLRVAIADSEDGMPWAFFMDNHDTNEVIVGGFGMEWFRNDEGSYELRLHRQNVYTQRGIRGNADFLVAPDSFSENLSGFLFPVTDLKPIKDVDWGFDAYSLISHIRTERIRDTRGLEQLITKRVNFLAGRKNESCGALGLVSLKRAQKEQAEPYYVVWRNSDMQYYVLPVSGGPFVFNENSKLCQVDEEGNLADAPGYEWESYSPEEQEEIKAGIKNEQLGKRLSEFYNEQLRIFGIDSGTEQVAATEGVAPKCSADRDNDGCIRIYVRMPDASEGNKNTGYNSGSGKNEN